MARSLDLPEDVYEALIAASRSLGVEPADWIAARLSIRTRRLGSNAERNAARDLLSDSSFSLGRSTGTENDLIDADLAREYEDPHEPR
jgi:hypothetical protein